jgi:hypothetical protein
MGLVAGSAGATPGCEQSGLPLNPVHLRREFRPHEVHLAACGLVRPGFSNWMAVQYGRNHVDSSRGVVNASAVGSQGFRKVRHLRYVGKLWENQCRNKVMVSTQ